MFGVKGFSLIDGLYLVVCLDEQDLAEAFVGIVGCDDEERVLLVDPSEIIVIRLLSEGIEFIAIARHRLVCCEECYGFGWQLRCKVGAVSREKAGRLCVGEMCNGHGCDD